MVYQTYEWICIGISCFLAVVYMIKFPSSAIMQWQQKIFPVWCTMYGERKKQVSIVAVQMLRNIMYISAMLAGATLNCGVIAATFGADREQKQWEFFVSTILFLIAFVHFSCSANCTYYMILNISLYPSDLCEGIPQATVDHSYATNRKLVGNIARHMNWGVKATMVAVPSCFITAHPIALLIFTVVFMFGWYYLDKYFGNSVGLSVVQSDNVGRAEAERGARGDAEGTPAGHSTRSQMPAGYDQ